mgnify:CR=1 FL=1
MVKKNDPVYKIGGNEIVIERKALQQNSKIQSVVLMAKQTYESAKSGKNEAVELKYAEVKKFVEANRDLLMGKDKHVQINIFGHQGWRAGLMFKPGNDIDWYSVRDAYKEKYEIDSVYAVQILIF